MSSPQGSATRAMLYTALAILFLLHQDFWLWNDARMLFGLPIGMTYHVLYCLLVAGLMALLVRFAWPKNLDATDPKHRPEVTGT